MRGTGCAGGFFGALGMHAGSDAVHPRKVTAYSRKQPYFEDYEFLPSSQSFCAALGAGLLHSGRLSWVTSCLTQSVLTARNTRHHDITTHSGIQATCYIRTRVVGLVAQRRSPDGRLPRH
jgi:hypothetical protein